VSLTADFDLVQLL